MSKLDVYQKITVDLKMDELDMTAAENKATYEEIREYVKEHTGLNVSDLYIAQVKRKCGIKERQNYNDKIDLEKWNYTLLPVWIDCS